KLSKHSFHGLCCSPPSVISYFMRCLAHACLAECCESSNSRQIASLELHMEPTPHRIQTSGAISLVNGCSFSLDQPRSDMLDYLRKESSTIVIVVMQE